MKTLTAKQTLEIVRGLRLRDEHEDGLATKKMKTKKITAEQAAKILAASYAAEIGDVVKGQTILIDGDSECRGFDKVPAVRMIALVAHELLAIQLQQVLNKRKR